MRKNTRQSTEQNTEQNTEQTMLRRHLLDGKQAVLFDMDGTLVDSMWIWRQIDIDFLGERKLSMPESLQADIEGMSFSETAHYFRETFGLTESEEEIKAVWNRMAFQKYRTEVPLKPGADEFLRWLKEQGLATAICTSNSRELIDMAVEARGIADRIDYVVTACEVNAGKPAPDIYLHAAEVLGVEPKNCVVFEDIPAGLLAGKRAGMTVCAVEDEYSAYCMDEKRRLADFVVKDFTELI